ncbi:phosphonate C-P lyase system protein PhnK [Skermania sp. ID1734]|uniref:phosphonate C-P lyase system protein PhnK n=1 Tax=Skermania sp. ID1734 TaxID=2597516 RepID=UPI00117CFBAD|nr:phosphonate C-P lyase system protein PhnK [Skermania sp. ID1734]TSD92931.1 phosphonate C-P lyase system protein PhnK [Skermania sp. ID1734]
MTTDRPLLRARGLSHRFGNRWGCRGVDIDVWPGEVVAVVGESGSGKSTLLNALSRRVRGGGGDVEYQLVSGQVIDLPTMPEGELRRLWRSEWGFVHQNAADGLRMHVTAGGNVGEPLMANGWRNYGQIRDVSTQWLERVEIPADRIDDVPTAFSGGMRQRLQIARNLVVSPRIVFMDEPTSGLDVSVQARLLDLIRSLVSELGLAVIVVTHDLAVARLISHRTVVMRHGEVIESGLTDRVLDDPGAPYTQLLVSSVLRG